MATRKSALCTCSKSVTVEGASTEHVDEETNQEMHEASMQGQFVFLFLLGSHFLYLYLCVYSLYCM